LVRHFEIKEINILNRYRAPLVAHLKDRANGTEFLVMVNHLARGKAEIRQKQATMLVDWARDQTLPVFALGDYNFDFVFKTRKGNPAFSNMLKDNIWRWVEPVELIDTNWYDNPRNPDGIDDYPGSILDFAFVAGSAKNWKSTCRVLVREGDFPDDKTTSDHRPFEMTIVKP
ncbi:MAG: endonuclease/exonuclease/phosphatase, partial [Planctomycetaceae bacterium]|nr:endonuclease/exonuclease/phosphatase [Planctomycetaceae bacterium]